MIVRELIEKLNKNTKENLWDIIVDGCYYDENKTDTLNTEVKSWDLEYCIESHFFQMFLIIHTVNFKEQK